MNRRHFFAVLSAPFLKRFVRLIPKRQPLTVVELVQARMDEAVLQMHKQLTLSLWWSGYPSSVVAARGISSEPLPLEGGTYIQCPIVYGDKEL